MKQLIFFLFALLPWSAAVATPNDVVITQANSTTGTAFVQTIIPGAPNMILATNSSSKVAAATHINGLPVGDVTPSTGAFTTLFASGNSQFNGMVGINVTPISPFEFYIAGNISGNSAASLVTSSLVSATAPGQTLYDAAFNSNFSTGGANTGIFVDPVVIATPTITTSGGGSVSGGNMLTIQTPATGMLYALNVSGGNNLLGPGSTTVGTGGTGTTQAILYVNGSSQAGYGSQIIFEQNGTSIGNVGGQNGIQGGSTNNLELLSLNAETFYTGNGSLALTLDASQNATFAGQIKEATNALVAATNQNLTPAPTALGNLTGTINIDWSKGNTFYGTLTGNTTFTFTNAVAGQNISVRVYQTGTNSFTVTWPTVSWPANTPPTMTTGSAVHDTTTFIFMNGTYDGSSVQNLKP